MNAVGREPVLARKAVARTLEGLSPEQAVTLLEGVIAWARAGDGEARSALSGVAAALRLEPELAARREAFLEAARTAGSEQVAALFCEAPAVRAMDPDAAAREDAKAFASTLGHLKQMARATRDPDRLSRLAGMSNPLILRNLLINPRLTEELVVRIASRRPARPEPLEEIWSSRWAVRPGVRRALVLNPYLPPELGAKIVPLLSRAEWAELAHDPAVHPALREQAAGLLGDERSA